jgi:hypothetical protein
MLKLLRPICAQMLIFSPEAENKEQYCQLRILFFEVLFRRGSNAQHTS